MKYFSVTYMTYIGDVRCVPQVCYKLGESVKGTVEDMVKKGFATIYDEEVRFISGVPMKLKSDRSNIPNAVEIKTVEPVMSKKRKGGKREFS